MGASETSTADYIVLEHANSAKQTAIETDLQSGVTSYVSEYKWYTKIPSIIIKENQQMVLNGSFIGLMFCETVDGKNEW